MIGSEACPGIMVLTLQDLFKQSALYSRQQGLTYKVLCIHIYIYIYVYHTYILQAAGAHIQGADWSLGQAHQCHF